jgi:flavin reductase (DIM6/NTAB) family NADH-FMN oxidoreductase RutF
MAAPMKSSFPPFVHSFPAPAVLVGCGTVEHPNLITISWTGTVCSDPPQISISVRRSRFSFNLIHEQREFTINIPRAADLPMVKLCGAASGRDVNKFEKLGITPVACPPLVDAPMIAESFLSLGCQVRHELFLGSHHMFVAEVVSLYGEASGDSPGGRPHLSPSDQIAYLDGKYWTLQFLSDRS